MLSVWTLGSVVLLYLLVLFAIAFWGERRLSTDQQSPVFYSLAMGVHCTSWAFFGTTTQAAQYGWAFIPTYLGNILVMLLAFSLVKRIVRLCHQHNVSSLADFLGWLFGRSHLLAATISVLCFLGVVPYIALQLDAVTRSITLLSGEPSQHTDSIGIYVSVLMAVFAILFGARTLSMGAKRPGLMLSVAMASALKLLAFLCIGLFVVYSLHDGVFDLLSKATQSERASEVLSAPGSPLVFLNHVLLGACALFCLPRQFHVTFVENKGDMELHAARWQFPLYLGLMTLFVLPIALAGHLYFETQPVPTDTYVLALPLAAEHIAMAVVAFLGGLAAATSMVIVATLAVGIMISNNLVTPLWLTLQLSGGQSHRLNPSTLLMIRRLAILSVLAIAYLYHLDVSRSAPLVNSGILSMALLGQCMPLILIGLWQTRAHPVAALAGLLTGAGCWFVWLLWPSIMSSYYFDPPPTDLALAKGFVLSLILNGGVTLLLTRLLPDRAAPTPMKPLEPSDAPPSHRIKTGDLLALGERVLDPETLITLREQAQEGKSNGYASNALVRNIERELTAQVGDASARILMSALTDKDQLPLPELVEWVEEASQTFQFNHEVLQSSVQHIQQGICVLDRNLCLLAWNQRYIEMFDYPQDVVKVGVPIEDLLTFNAKRGLLADCRDPRQQIKKRIAYLRDGSRYKYLRRQKDGKVIELNGSPLPGGGFVTTYSDITEYMAIQHQLEQARDHLEARVTERTAQLEAANSALAVAKQTADKANQSKTRFLAAAGHDLMQPFNAASLFASLLRQQLNSEQHLELADNLVQSLGSAEELLSMLLDMTKLESGVLETHKQALAVDSILQPLVTEFSALARQKGLQLRYVPSSLWTFSDKKLLRRIMQNLLSNAVRYTREGRILVGVRRQGDHLSCCIWDTGQGIAEQDQHTIFQEFRQLGGEHNQQGLGLGLTIVERISTLLEHPVSLQSVVGKGTCFSVLLPRQEKPETANSPRQTTQSRSGPILANRTVVCVDNEAQSLMALSDLLRGWGASVICGCELQDIENQLQAKDGIRIDLMMLDYHLDNGKTGIEVAEFVRRQQAKTVPGILNSAERGDAIRDIAAEAELNYVPKPLKTAALKQMIRQVLQ